MFCGYAAAFQTYRRRSRKNILEPFGKAELFRSAKRKELRVGAVFDFALAFAVKLYKS